MTYSSLLFIYGFLPLSLLVHKIMPEKFKQMSLLVLSGIFYALNSLWFLFLMIAFAVINYLCGLFVFKYHRKKFLSAIPLFIGIFADLTIFFLFRTDCLNILRDRLGISKEFFPLGVSFVTLTCIGYLIDIFRKRLRPEFNFIKLSLYIMFFPKLFIIVRYKTFSRMLDNNKMNLSEAGAGLRIFIKGLVKKVIAGDTMYMLYSAVGTIDIWKLSAVNAWIGITAYFLYIYFVLSGISDMGAGIGYCFGFKLPQSFNYPIFSTKMRDFVSRWHIQIIYWFRRYISKPLGEISKNRIYKKFTVIFTWSIIGLWYKFDINGFIWGLLIGIAVILEKYIQKFRLMNITGIIYTYIVTIICMVFLSGNNITDSLNYLLAMLGGNKIFADSITLYLLKYYIIMLLVCMYFSTNLFRNLLMRSNETCLKNIVLLISPALTVFMLVICTIFISYSGSSEILLLEL